MKFSKTVICALAFLVCAGAYAQNNVEAVLLEESSGDPIPFATVSLTKPGQAKPYKYVLSDGQGLVKFESVRNGEYTFKAEQMGYLNFVKDIKMEGKAIDLGEIKMKLDTQLLDAASVSAVGNPIIIKKDTIEYNASSFKTTENDVLEDLLKKLPGIEVSEDGSITMNGETITKVYIDGKTFFMDDPQLASKNIPAKIVNKLKVIQKKSEQAEFTGIDDGEEETVIDLSVKPGMMKGLFGNIMAGAGHDIPSTDVSGDTRFQAAGFVGKFTDKSQISVILNGNNTNNRGFNDLAGNMMGGMMGGGGMMGRGQGGWGGGNGITTSYMGGVNGGWDLFDDKMDLTANYLYNHSKSDVKEQSIKNTHLDDHDLLYNSNGISNRATGGHRFGVRLEHEFSKNTSIIFEPQVNFGSGAYTQISRDSTYYNNFVDPEYKINSASTNNTGSNRNLSTSGFLLFRQRLGIPGRTLTAMARYSLSNNEMNGLNRNSTKTFDANGDEISDALRNSDVDQTFNNRQNSYSAFGRVTYTEPIGNNFYVEANYSYNWNKSTSNKTTVDNRTGEIALDYTNHIINDNHRQEMGANVMYQSEALRAQLGFAAMPNKTYNSTTKGAISKEYEDFQWNFAPQAMLWWEMNDKANLRFFYRGRSSQPSTSQLMPVPDNTNPLSLTFGNPTLKPYFSHNLNGDFRFNNKQKFSSVNVRFNGSVVQNPIVSALWYNNVGGQYNLPVNGRNSANFGGNMFMNIPVAKSGFSINNMLRANWSKSSSYVGKNVPMHTLEDPTKGYYDFMEEFIAQDYLGKYFAENITKNISFTERLRLIYRTDNLELTASGRTRMNKSWYTITDNKQNTTTWNNQLSASVNWTWDQPGMEFKTDFDYNWYNGYETAQPSQYVLNAEISKMLFQKKVTVTLKGYDILGQSKNLTVSDIDNYHTESINNTLGRYIILSLTYRFGTFDKGKMGRGMGGYGGHGGPPPMMR